MTYTRVKYKLFVILLLVVFHTVKIINLINETNMF